MVALFVAFMFVGLVLTDLAVEKWSAWRVAHAARADGVTSQIPAYVSDASCRVPDGVYVTGQHTWIKPHPARGLEIGVDVLVAHAVGTVRQIMLPKVGAQIAAGQPLFRLKQNGHTVTVPSAVTGRVTAVNSRLAEHPELLSSDPYGNGWVCYVTPTRWEEAAHRTRFGDQAAAWLESEFGRFRDFVFGQVSPDLALGVTSQDGGIPASGCLSELGPTAWSAFETSFLRRK